MKRVIITSNPTGRPDIYTRFMEYGRPMELGVPVDTDHLKDGDVFPLYGGNDPTHAHIRQTHESVLESTCVRVEKPKELSHE